MKTCIASGEKSGNGVIMGAPALFYGMLVTTDGVNAATVTIWDNASAGSGKKIWSGVVPGATRYYSFTLTVPVACENGIYLSLSGTGALAYLFYDRS